MLALHFCDFVTNSYGELSSGSRSSLGEHKEVDQYDHYDQVPDEDHVVLVHLKHGEADSGFFPLPAAK